MIGEAQLKNKETFIHHNKGGAITELEKIELLKGLKIGKLNWRLDKVKRIHTLKKKIKALQIIYSN